MSGVSTEIVGADDAGIRLDRWFKKHHPEVPHGRLSKLIRKGEVRIDGKRAKTSDRVETGQAIRVPPLGPRPEGAAAGKARTAPVSEEDAQAIRAMVIHEDKSVFVLNKPPGLPVQGGSGVRRHLDGMLDALAAKGGARPRLVHRIDKDTSGCLVLARTEPAARALTRIFRTREAEKTYWALVKGVPEPRDGRIDLAIDKLPGRGGEKMAPSEDGKRALTDFVVIEAAAGEAAWVALRPLTGRTHQLRVHMAAIGTPIVGDGKYGGAEAFLTGSISRKLHLHARAISLPHPDGGRLEVTAPLPPHMAASWKMLGFDADYAEDPFEIAED